MSYLQPDVITRAQVLGIKARTVVEGLRVGDHKSPYRGFSVEFVQHREYVPGDDIRHIDWKSYGRSERYTIKQYEQETNFSDWEKRIMRLPAITLKVVPKAKRCTRTWANLPAGFCPQAKSTR